MSNLLPKRLQNHINRQRQVHQVQVFLVLMIQYPRNPMMMILPLLHHQVSSSRVLLHFSLSRNRHHDQFLRNCVLISQNWRVENNRNSDRCLPATIYQLSIYYRPLNFYSTFFIGSRKEKKPHRSSSKSSITAKSLPPLKTVSNSPRTYLWFGAKQD